METQLETPEVTAAFAAHSDLAGVAAMGPDFWREGNLPGGFNPDVFVRTWSALIDLGFGRVLVLKRGAQVVGALGFFIVSDPNDGAKVMQEAFWFVHPSARGAGLRLLLKYEEAARELGAKRISMAHINGLMDGKLAKLFEKRGYRAVETHYWRTI